MVNYSENDWQLLSHLLENNINVSALFRIFFNCILYIIKEII